MLKINLLIFLYYILLIITQILALLITTAFFTLFERKVLGSIQRRLGPNVIGFWGFLQPFADALKLLTKEIIIPTKANKILFSLAPIISLALALFAWGFIPYSTTSILFEDTYSSLILLAISSLSVYGVIIAGWASNSRYAFLGACRSAAQMVSYEIALTTCLLSVFLLSGSLNVSEIVKAQEKVWFFAPLLPIFIIYLISCIAETNRAPFDLPEAEAELVAGFNTEYSAIMFACFFLGEYSNMILMSTTIVLFFFGGWQLPNIFFFLKNWPILIFATKVIFFCFIFILVRSILPRYRYDQLMELGWKIYLPLTLSFFFFLSMFMGLINCAPVGNYGFLLININKLPFLISSLDYFLIF